MKFYSLNVMSKSFGNFYWYSSGYGENAKVSIIKKALAYRRSGIEVKVIESESEDITSFLDTL